MPLPNTPQWTNEAQALVRRLLDSYLASSPPGALADVVREKEALPVCTKPGLTILLRPDGIVLTSVDEPELKITSDPAWRWIAALEASELYPELRILLPERPPNARTCPACSGTGQLSFPPENPSRCGTCWGIGWLAG